jgi:hypothetical protein
MNQGSEQVASYLEGRRQRRLGIVQETGVLEEDDTTLTADEDQAQIFCTPLPPPSFFNSDAFWFTLSGIVLGVAISIVTSIIKQPIEKQ